MPDVRIALNKKAHQLWNMHAERRDKSLAGFIRDVVNDYLATAPLPGSIDAQIKRMTEDDQ